MGVLKVGNGNGRVGSEGAIVGISITSIASSSWVVDDAGESVGLEADGGGGVEVM